MKSIKSVLLLVTFLLFIFTTHSYARDTDLYVGTDSTIEPNILIIFDNSGSMGDSPTWNSFCEYIATYSYPQPTSTGLPSTTSTKVYKQVSSKWINSGSLSQFATSVSAVGCSSARSGLNGSGLYSGYTNAAGTPKSTSKECTSSSYVIATGNYLRWLYADPVNTAPCRSKMDIAKGVIENFVNTITGVRLGLMVYNSNTEGGHIVDNIRSLDESYSGCAGNTTHRANLICDIDALYPDSYTPLAETLYEAGLYYQGAQSYFNSPPFTDSTTTYTTPIQYYCQKNYIVFMTDGISTEDRNTILQSIGTSGDMDGDDREPPDQGNDPGFTEEGSDYMDDVAKYLYDSDLHSMQGKQNVITYTIGFELDSSDPTNAPKAKDLLQRTATYGHGKFFTTSGAGGLADAFANILNDVLAVTSSFVAPIVPVSKMERTTAGDYIYLAFFRPSQSGMWSGNIKKYKVQKTNAGSLVVGDILDANGSKALDANGAFYPSSKSFWTTSSSDGGEVQAGGVGEVLQNRTTARNIYTLLPGDASDEDNGPDANTSFDLTNGWNAFTTTNSRLTTTILGVSTTTDKNNLINFVRGIDVYDDNTNGDTTDKRDWMLGSFLHSRPFVIQYKDRTVIYAGANDGMLHAFNDSDGQELWGFIPPCLLGNLKNLHTDALGDSLIFVDGSPKAYVTYDANGNVTKAILIFGLRRGGNYYYALDVTDPLVPKYLWRIYANKKKGITSYYQDLGQTWSTPVIGKVNYGTGEKWVAVFGGGYDDGQDQSNPPPDTQGRAVYMADVLTGDCIWWHSYPGGDTNMTYCVPSDVATIDLDGDGRIDRLYMGDANGRMWRFDLTGGNPDNWTGRMIFKSNAGSSEKRKIFYPPDVTFEKDSTGEYEMLFFGTGDREAPNSDKDMDRLYAFKDRNASGTKAESDLVNVTNFYSLSAAQQKSTIDSIKTGYGYYLILDKKAGEKCLATPLVYYKTAYFTSFSPDTSSITDPCYIGEGTGTIYALNYSTGEAVFNYDLTNDTNGGKTVVKGKTDRSLTIGSAIPSGVVVTVIGGKVTAYVGVGGGVYKPTLSSTRSLFPVNWKLVF